MNADTIVFSGNQARDETTGFTRIADSGAGGAIWASYPTLTAKNMLFENNLAYTMHDDGGLGGAIWAGNMTLTADNIVMRNNRAEGEKDHAGLGGAIFGQQVLDINGNVLLDGNVATGKIRSSGQGGAIFAFYKLYMNGSSTIRNNIASGEGQHSGLGGGVISREFSIANASFINNQAIGDGADYSGLGGGIYFHTQGYTHTSPQPSDTASIGVLIAENGQETLFRGNTQGTIADRRRNAIYMGNYIASGAPNTIATLRTGVLQLRAVGSGMISFHDPIASDKRPHQVDVNPLAGDTGWVRFWGDNRPLSKPD